MEGPESPMVRYVRKEVTKITGNPNYDISEILSVCREGTLSQKAIKLFEEGWNAAKNKP